VTGLPRKPSDPNLPPLSAFLRAEHKEVTGWQFSVVCWAACLGSGGHGTLETTTRPCQIPLIMAEQRYRSVCCAAVLSHHAPGTPELKDVTLFPGALKYSTTHCRIWCVMHAVSGQGQRSRYNDSLLAGRFGYRILVGARFTAPVQTGFGTHPAYYKLGKCSLSGG